MYKPFVLTVGLIGILITPLTSRADDQKDLVAAFQEALTAINTRNVEAFVELMDDGVVYFLPNIPLPAVGKAANERVWSRLLADNDSVTFVPIKPQFHISGNTGIAWGHYVSVAQAGDISLDAFIGRYTITYTKVAEGDWRMIVIHNSSIPVIGSQ